MLLLKVFGRSGAQQCGFPLHRVFKLSSFRLHNLSHLIWMGGRVGVRLRVRIFLSMLVVQRLILFKITTVASLFVSFSVDTYSDLSIPIKASNLSSTRKIPLAFTDREPACLSRTCEVPVFDLRLSLIRSIPKYLRSRRLGNVYTNSVVTSLWRFSPTWDEQVRRRRH